jgi:hypothetical protein
MRICGLLFLLFTFVGLSAAQDTNFSVGPQYLLNGPALFARPIATPSLSLSSPMPGAGPDFAANDRTNVRNAPYSSTPELEGQADLLPIYYGYPRVSVVEINFSEESREVFAALPASITNSGVTELVDAQVLRLRGYGITLPEASSYWKTHKASASHHYTNSDIERLHSAAN